MLFQAPFGLILLIRRWPLLLTTLIFMVGCAGGGPTEAETATCHEARDVRTTLAAGPGTDAGAAVDEMTQAIRELAEAANRTENRRLRDTSTELRTTWTRGLTEAKDDPGTTPPAAVDVADALRTIIDECDRLGVEVEQL